MSVSFTTNAPALVCSNICVLNFSSSEKTYTTRGLGLKMISYLRFIDNARPTHCCLMMLRASLTLSTGIIGRTGPNISLQRVIVQLPRKGTKSLLRHKGVIDRNVPDESWGNVSAFLVNLSTKDNFPFGFCQKIADSSCGLLTDKTTTNARLGRIAIGVEFGVAKE